MPKTILICEDDEALRELARETLAGHGYEILEAADGKEALKLARSAQPDIVLLDLVLPGLSGLDVLAQIRSNPWLADTRVILCSGSTRVLDAEAAAEFGADAYLVKPYSPGDLVSLVAALIARGD